MKIKDNIPGLLALAGFEEANPHFFDHCDLEYRIYVPCRTAKDFLERFALLTDPEVTRTRDYLNAEQRFGPGVVVKLYIEIEKCGRFEAADPAIRAIIDGASNAP